MKDLDTFFMGIFVGLLCGGLGVPYLSAYLEGRDRPELGFEIVEMNVSAFCPCDICCGIWADGITASGVEAKGKLIAAPNKYAFGTVMEVPGYGRALVQDRGGSIKDNKIDLLFCDKDGVSGHDRALEWGRQYLEVKVFNK